MRAVETLSGNTELTEKIKNKARNLGFDLVHVLPVLPSQSINIYGQWLAKGYSGDMGYLNRHFEKKQDLRNVMPETLSLISLGINYYTVSIPESEKNSSSKGKISSYAWGTDYHLLVREKLEALRQFIKETIPRQKNSRVYVDTGPILEREYAYRAGLGWLGKNSMLINWKEGSWFFLAEILLDTKLIYDAVVPRGDCGNCTKCLEACPTDAIVPEGQIDARRCISYLTIELKGPIPQQFRSSMGNLVFGCDICQEVCPWNNKASISREPGFRPRAENIMPELIPLMYLTQDEFNIRFKNSAVKRAKRRGFLRNVAIALGNWGSPLAIPALNHGLQDAEPLIRSHSAWALGQIEHADAKTILEEASRNEHHTGVIQEIQDALSVQRAPTV